MSAPSLKIATWKICGICLFGSLCSLPARTFTSTDGRKLEGEVVDANNTIVSIKRTSDGRTLKVPMDSLSAENLKEIAEWRTAKALGKLVFTATKEKVSSSTSKTGGTREQLWCWVITVRNNSPHPLTGSTLRWSQVVERTDRNQSAVAGAAKTVSRSGKGSMPLPELGAFQTIKIKSDAIDVQSYSSATFSTTTAPDGGRMTRVDSTKWDEVLSGLSLDVGRGFLAPAEWSTGARTSALPKVKP